MVLTVASLRIDLCPKTEVFPAIHPVLTSNIPSYLGSWKPNSRSTLTGEQPDPSYLLQQGDVLSRPCCYSMIFTPYSVICITVQTISSTHVKLVGARGKIIASSAHFLVVERYTIHTY
jgi:hypothetical protein